jgi:hypothetical protein
VQTIVQDQQTYPAMRDQGRRLTWWSLPHDHFEKDTSNFFEIVPEEVPEVKYPQSYQDTFGGTPGTVHINGEGVVFAYFNHGSKALGRVKISPAHAHMVIPTENRSLIPSQRPNPTRPQRSAKQLILGMLVPTVSLQQPTLGMPIQTSPLQQSTTMQAVLIPANMVAHTRSSCQQPINQGASG